MIIIILSVVLGAILIWIISSYIIELRTEEFSYEVIDSTKEYEIRSYFDYVIAETDAEGDIVEAGESYFNILAGYISGDNERQEKIAMTTPVISDPGSEKIAMTKPVIKDKNKFIFVMPAKYALENLPKPNDDRVIIKKGEPMKVAVLRFNGFFTDKNYEKHRDELESYLERDDVQYSRIISAGYSPPWTPFFMKRLEVWAVLEE